jgi:hypothetical protein
MGTKTITVRLKVRLENWAELLLYRLLQYPVNGCGNSYLSRVLFGKSRFLPFGLGISTPSIGLGW